MFDVPKLADYAFLAIEKFAQQHPDELFYAFAIDADMLCLNTIEAFEESLSNYSAKWPKQYDTDEKISKLKYGPGDWKYQGFASLRDLSTEDENGYPIGPFDEDLYDKHYYLDDEDQKTSAYAIAMNEILEVLKSRNAFQGLKKTEDFRIGRVEHNY